MSTRNDGHVITFYSYKGGTGRSMALANVACILANNGQNVLMMDWDLEAPGLHRYFRQYFKKVFKDGPDLDHAIDMHPGLIDFFSDLYKKLEKSDTAQHFQTENGVVELLESVNIEKYLLQTDFSNLQLLKAGCFDENYSSNVNTFDWEGLYNHSPVLLRSMANWIGKKYDYVLLDSRTGITDTSGICTMLMPEKLVVVFTPNLQSLTGIIELVREATDYRENSDDLRPLLIFPLISRIEPAENVLRKYWRYGNTEQGILGYQPQFEKVFRDIYALNDCNLETYFNEILVQHVPEYSFGEEISVVAGDYSTSMALSIRYHNLADVLIKDTGPWDLLKEERVKTKKAKNDLLWHSDLSPYPGLMPFSEEYSPVLFGQERVIDSLLQNLRQEPRFLALLGSSGSGKSSVINAGLIPMLKNDSLPGSSQWKIIVIAPHENPFKSLEQIGLEESSEDLSIWVKKWLQNNPRHTKLMLVIDQFEEIFTICQNDIRKKFFNQVKKLLTDQLSVSVLFVMRDSFYGDFIQHAPTLLDWFQKRLINLPPSINSREIIDIIKKPADFAGVLFQEGLSDLILKDVIGTTKTTSDKDIPRTVLPLLAFALRELWEQSRKDWLTVENYQSIGGLSGSLTVYAEKVFSSFDKNQQELVRRILPGLVQFVGDNQETLISKPRPINAFVSSEKDEAKVLGVVNKMLEHRLLIATAEKETSGEGKSHETSISLVNDALIYNWGRLKNWLDEDREFLLWRQRLNVNLAEWKSGRALLLQGKSFTDAEHWLSTRPTDFSSEEIGYIQTSKKQREFEIARAEEARNRELEQAQRLVKEKMRSSKRLKLSFIVISIAFISTVGLLLFSVQQYYLAEKQTNNAKIQAERAKTETENATKQRAIAQTQVEIANKRLAHYFAAESQINLDSWPQRSLLLAVEAASAAQIQESKKALQLSIAKVSGIPIHLSMRKEIVNGLTLSPNGKYFAASNVAGENNYIVRIWSLEKPDSNPSEIKTLNSVDRLLFSNNEEILALNSIKSIELWNTQTNSFENYIYPTELVSSLAFNHKGNILAIGTREGSIQLWRIDETVKKLKDFKINSEVTALSFHPENKILASAAKDKKIRFWMVDGPNKYPKVKTIEHKTDILSLVFSPNGNDLVFGGLNGEITLLSGVSDFNSKENFRNTTLKGHNGAVLTLAFSKDGDQLTSGSSDNKILLYDMSNLSIEPTLLLGHEDAILDLAFISSKEQLISASVAPNGIRTWDIQNLDAKVRILATVNNGKKINSTAINPNGRTVAAAISDGNILIFDIVTGKKIKEIFGQNSEINSIAFSPNGETIAAAGVKGIIRIWDLYSGSKMTELFGPENEIFFITFSPDGNYIASVDKGGIIRIWDISSGQEFITLSGHEQAITQIAISPDARNIASTDLDGNVRLWDIETGRKIANLPKNREVISDITFSPDGRNIATADFGGTVRISNLSAYSKLEAAILPSEDHAAIGSISYSPNGEQLASANIDGVIRIWNLNKIETNPLILEGNINQPYNFLKYSPDGLSLIGATNDSILVWTFKKENSDLQIEKNSQLISLACERAGRNLTREEWKKYMGETDYRFTCPQFTFPE